MEQNNARHVLLTAFVIGLAGDALLQNAAPGVNIFLLTGAIICAAWFLRRRNKPAFPGTGAALLCLGAASGFALRDSPTLVTLAGFGLAACALLGVRHAGRERIANFGVLELFAALAQTARNILQGGVRLLRQKEAWGVPSNSERRAQNMTAVLRGLLLTVPLLLVFGALLSSADPVFAHFVAAAFGWDASRAALHLLWIAAGTTLAGGVLLLLTTPAEDAPERKSAPPFLLGGVETVLILGALDGLFAAFVLVQARYFFGGRDAVLSTVGMTYAAYARHGFFELVWVAGLCLPLLLTLHAAQKPGAQKQFTVLAGVLVALLFVIMASALGRMSLYRSEYGLTELRLYTTAFMGWLAVVFVWFVATVLRGRRELFALGAAGLAAAGVVALFVLNPDATIVRANVRLTQSGKVFDACYATALSADAVPALVESLPSLPVPAQQITASRLLARWGTSRLSDWREENWGRWTAERAVQNSVVHLSALAAAAPARPCQRAEDDN